MRRQYFVLLANGERIDAPFVIGYLIQFLFAVAYRVPGQSIEIVALRH